MKRARQHGLTMVELSVAAAVGLLALLFAALLLASANHAYLAQAEAAEVEDGGRYALDVISRAVRQAAFVNWDSGEAGVAADPSAPPRIAGLDAQLLSRASNAIDQPQPGAINGSDVLALRFDGAGAGPSGDGSINSCAGFGVGARDDGWSIFYVAQAASGDAELRCKYRGAKGWGADAIVGGVDSFQVLYGLDTDNPPDGLANLYVRAGVVQALDDALLLEGGDAAERLRDLRRRTHWKRVASVKVGLVLHGHKRAPAQLAPAVYELFGRDYSDAQGAQDPGTRISEAELPPELRARERRLFTATILLRNSSH